MTPITPKALSERSFAKVLRGYNPAEVDAYCNRVVENYSLLYRENIELAKRITELAARLETVADEEAAVRRSLEGAKRAGDKIIEEAYIKADDILVAIKKSCDAILRSFRDKVEAQKAAQAEITQSVTTFKNELFEKYRLHIELLEQLSPSYEYEEPTAEEYVEHIVADLKREVAAQYGVPLDSLTPPEEPKKPSAPKAEPTPYKEPQAVEKTPAAVPQAVKESTPNKVSQAAEKAPVEAPEAVAAPAGEIASAPQKTPAKKRKPRAVPSVVKLLDEYEDKDVLGGGKKDVPKVSRFMLDIDGESGEGQLILSGK